MQRQMRVIQGTALEARPRSGIESAYDHFRLERQGELVSQSTLDHYDYMVQPFLDWLRREQPEVRRFEDLGCGRGPGVSSGPGGWSPAGWPSAGGADGIRRPPSSVDLLPLGRSSGLSG
jgi:hypothetical protein